MSDAELRRLRQDIDTIRQAAGMDLPFEWADVRHAVGLIPAGAFLAAWAYFGPADSLPLGLVLLLLLALVAGRHWLWRRRGSGPAGTARRSGTFDMVVGLVVATGLAVYFVWVRKFGLVHGPPGIPAVFFLGILCAVLGLTSSRRRVFFAGAVALIPFALVAPLCGSQQMTTVVGGLLVMPAGAVAAAIMAWQLRNSRRDDEPVTH
jgi:hypothetical protein